MLPGCQVALSLNISPAAPLLPLRALGTQWGQAPVLLLTWRLLPPPSSLFACLDGDILKAGGGCQGLFGLCLVPQCKQPERVAAELGVKG